MATINILAHENTRLIESNDSFSLYLYSGTVRKDLSVLFKSDELAIFVCLSGLAAGFNNASYFFRVFKKQIGKLPLEWRKKHSVAAEIAV